MSAHDLEAEIHDAVALAIHGELADSRLELKARDAVRAVLARHRIRGAQVSSRLVRGGIALDVKLPPSVPRVRHIRLRVG